MYEASKVQQTVRIHLEQIPYVVRRDVVLSMFAEKADSFHRSSTSDSGALVSFCHFRVVSLPSMPSGDRHSGKNDQDLFQDQEL